jgi:hypothetical protein
MVKAQGAYTEYCFLFLFFLFISCYVLCYAVYLCGVWVIYLHFHRSRNRHSMKSKRNDWAYASAA